MHSSTSTLECQLGPAVLNQATGELSPPEGSTGAQTAFLDWLAFTFPDGTDIEHVKLLLGPADWAAMDRGFLGYRQALRRGHVTICFDGMPGMGVHVEVSGRGCRELESAGVVASWSDFLSRLLSLPVSFSRLDVALDEFSGLLDVDRVRQWVRDGLAVCRYRTTMLYEEVNPQTGEEIGGGVRFGSGQAETLIRIYDKAKEQHLPGIWNRCELQTRGKRATELARILAAADGLSPVSAVVRGLLDFKVQGTHSQRERWASAAWWDAFLGTVGKLRLTVQKVLRSVSESLAWIEHAVSPLLAAVVDAVGGSHLVLPDLLRNGRARWSARHVEMIRAFKQERRSVAWNAS